ncbi:MAG TPA: 16S rRNA (adenine(1518)-N(6)/adenine(1519)-N(6))-dimethyltransferase RsmA [Candidatus Paceibacterota bacterium]|jgi:16S rRNA (adenine1518-N6/adenine1519-N6)-dimethyltransferase
MQRKKSLGQHFLTSKKIAAAIAETANLAKDDTVLEIGPGGGVLTRELVAHANHVIAIEKDSRLISTLRKQFPEGVTVIEGDALTADLVPLGLRAGRYKVVANIPYYITGALLERFLSEDHYPAHMVLLLQKEVAERIVTRDEKESILSISVKAYGTPRIALSVPRQYFKPLPKVDSAVLSIENISKDFFFDVPERRFFALVKAGFAHKRKLFASNIASFFPDKNALARAFTACQLDLKIRAEDVSLSQWKTLARLTTADNV